MTQPSGETYVRKANESGTGVHWEVEKSPQTPNKPACAEAAPGKRRRR
jgi:hypothetical protein